MRIGTSGLIWEMFDREMDAGTRIYVQYESENNYYAVDYRSWVQDDELTAMLAGDLVCMDGASRPLPGGRRAPT